MRKPMVTRTIQTTEVTLLCLDIESAEPCNKDCVLPRTYKDEDAMLKAAKEVIDTDTIKCVSVVRSEVKETLYGMDEAKFIENAEVLPPRTAKPVED